MSDEKKKSFTPFGLSWPLCLGFIIIVAAGVMTGSLSTDLAGGFAFMLALGIICNEIGERIHSSCSQSCLCNIIHGK